MAGSRVDLDDLIDIMANARSSIVNSWDVLCSYDLKALNGVLEEEYKKNPVNSRLKFSVTKDIIGTPLHINCDLLLGNPTLGFSTVESGTYNLNIPIENGSRCTQSFLSNSRSTEIPEGFTILTSGPIRTVVGSGVNQTIHDSTEIVVFGDRQQANIVLHFGDKLRNVNVLPKNKSKELDDLFMYVTHHFVENIKEVDYNIIQVVKHPDNEEGLVLTPKSFIVTTQADENNLQNGALNIWIQTNESGKPRGNGQPSFYPHQNVLPVSTNYTSSIFFSHTLINELYMKPALEKYYDTMITDLTINNTVFSEVIALMPKNIEKQYFNLKADNDQYDKNYEYELDYKESPYRIFTHNNKLQFVWKYETGIKNVETRTQKLDTGTIISLVLGSVTFGNIPLLVDQTTKILDNLTKYLKLTVLIEKSIDFDVIDNTKFSAKVNLEKGDLKVYVEKVRASGVNLFGRSEEVNWDEIKNILIPKLEETIFMPEIDLGTLNYFAEANILFNDERFRVSPDKAVHFPYDTMVVGDITDAPPRLKREQKRTLKNSELLTSSANAIKSPINTAIKWLSVGFDHLKYYNPIKLVNGLLYKHPQIISDTNKSCTFQPKNILNYDFNTTLILSDYVIRNLTKMKPPLNTHQEPLNLLDVKAFSLGIIEELEELSKGVPLEVDFEPISLMSKIEHEIINGCHKNVEKILLGTVASCDLNAKMKIEEMLKVPKGI